MWFYCGVFVPNRKNNCIFVIGLRNTQPFVDGIWTIVQLIKRPKVYSEQTIGTPNAHASYAWVVLLFVRVLGRPFQLKVRPRFSFLEELNGCYFHWKFIIV